MCVYVWGCVCVHVCVFVCGGCTCAAFVCMLTHTHMLVCVLTHTHVCVCVNVHSILAQYGNVTVHVSVNCTHLYNVTFYILNM